MDLIELQDFVDWEIGRLREFNGRSDEEAKAWDAVKLNEEVGELMSEVIGHSGLQRKEKMDGFCEDGLGEEFADVVITACILARRHRVDIIDALARKVEKIRGRRYK